MATQNSEVALLQQCGLCGGWLDSELFSAAHCGRCDKLMMDVDGPDYGSV